MAVPDPLARFSPAVAAWFTSSFPEPTAAQAAGWPSIADGAHTLICAPTGSGKTLTAFLWGIDRIASAPVPDKMRRTRVLYLSPLRALAVDVEKNLRSPIAGVAIAAERLGMGFTAPVVGVRTGDTSARDRQQMARNPPDICITTPESLYLMLTSNARESLRGVEAVIIDEIHALCPTKRGAHLAVSLERLEAICERPPQRIGLSATARPLEEVARFLGGFDAPGRPRPVTIVDAGVRKQLEVEVVVPVEDMGEMGRTIEVPMSGPAAAGPAKRSIWPSIHPEILRRILEHRTTIVFCNARRLAERLAARLNELAADSGIVADDGSAIELVKAHHGSLSREQRLVIEDDLKSGRLRAIVATSSLELGIDMGSVDLVIQVESPGAVSRGLQRIGRAGHQVGAPSTGVVFPKHRGDLVEAAVVVDAMHRGQIETMRYLRNPLDVLAQQIVASVAMDDVDETDLAAMVRRSAPFAELGDAVLGSVLDLLDGRYPSEEFAELRARLVRDRVNGRLRARDGSRRLAVTSGGTIPDRGLFGVFLPDGTRVGELDEEMVYESRAGETFLLGASTWRIEDITFERVIVTPAPGVPGKMPFWHGDRPGRPLELGRELGAFVREVRSVPPEHALTRLRERHGLDELAAINLVRYLDEQLDAAGAVPDDRTIVVERFADEIGDWRVVVLSPFGTPVHAPWAMALQGRLEDRFGVPVEVQWGDDGIVVRLPEAADDLGLEDLVFDPDEIEALVVARLPSTSLFSSRFRECAARALMLPRRRPDRRTPLWQQRQRAADLLSVAAKHPSFPILLEATRECLQDVFDVPALRSVLADLRSRKVRMVRVDTQKPSPFSQSLLFSWIAAYMYEGDAPLAERRAAALALDPDLLAELLGDADLRELLDPDVVDAVELELQCLADGRRARTLDEAHDVLRRVGDLAAEELAARCEASAEVVETWIAALLAERRAAKVRVADEDRVIAAEDAGRYRDALGCAIPLGLPAAFTEPEPDALVTLVGRFARTHGPFVAHDVARRLGTTDERVLTALSRLAADERVVSGEFRPGGGGREWCDAGVLRQLRRRSLAALRREVEPVDEAAFARFLPSWQGVGGGRRGLDALAEAIAVLQGAALPASLLDAVLSARVEGYRPADLEALCTGGEVVWVGAGAIGSGDGRLRLCFRDSVAALSATAAADADERPSGAVHDAIRTQLAERGASFWNQLVAAAPGTSEAELLAALWDLVWAGEVTNDALSPVRAAVAGRITRATGSTGSGARSRPRPGRLNRLGPPAGAGRWSLVSTLLEPRPTPTAATHAMVLQLLERHGVVTREGVLAEQVPGGFAGVYGVLKVLEERGQVRRGYFVAGLGAAQFAVAGAVDRLRAVREPDPEAAAVVLPAADPAQPFGAALAWPLNVGRPSRVATAIVVSREGIPLVWFDRSSHALLRFPGAANDDGWIDALVRHVKDGASRSIEVRKIDGEPAIGSDLAERLAGAGFAHGYKGWVLRT